MCKGSGTLVSLSFSPECKITNMKPQSAQINMWRGDRSVIECGCCGTAAAALELRSLCGETGTGTAFCVSFCAGRPGSAGYLAVSQPFDF